MEMPVTLPVIEFVKGTYSYRLGTEIATWMEKKKEFARIWPSNDWR